MRIPISGEAGGVCGLRIKVIVNPKAGRRIVQKNLEIILGRLLLNGVAASVDVTSTQGKNDAKNAVLALDAAACDLIIACGGDGTVNEIVEGLMESGKKLPLAILAAGTSNDFAVSLRLPQDPDSFCRMIAEGYSQLVDVGRANSFYFINIACFGMFTEVAHKTEREAKGNLGRLAYYLKGLTLAPEQLLMNMPVRISSPDFAAEDDIRLFLICNSTSAGMIRNLLPRADVCDGKFDVLILRKKNLLRKGPELLPYITSGEFLKDPAIVNFQTNHIHIDALDKSQNIELDLDGEYRGGLPLEVDIFHQAIRLLMPKDDPDELDLRQLFATPPLNNPRGLHF